MEQITTIAPTQFRTFFVDLDGTLCEGSAFTIDQVLNAKPVQHMIDKVNSLYQMNYIIIYTARIDELIPASLEWLRRNNVKFHAISNLKVPGYYIDDRMISFEDFLKL